MCPKTSRKSAFWSASITPLKTGSSSASDLAERAYFDDYQRLYEQVIDANLPPRRPRGTPCPPTRNGTSRYLVSEIVVDALEHTSHNYPVLSTEAQQNLQDCPHPIGGREQLMAPIRVLQVMPAMDAGGMETFVMNVYRTIDRDKVQFDFLYHYDKPCFFDDEICTLGGSIYKMTVRQDNNLPRYLRELRELFAAHPEWRIIHGHYSGFGMFYNPVARRAGIPVRVGHSHNTAYEPNLVGRLDKLMSSRFNAGLTDRFACSQKAGEMLFGKSPFTVLPNGIDNGPLCRPRPAAAAPCCAGNWA